MNNWSGLNRRKFPRVTYPCLITLRHENEKLEVILTHTENIGIGGFSIVIKRSINLFSSVELELDLLDTGNHIKCKGKVVWVIRRKNNEQKKPLFYDVGIEFCNIHFAEQKRLNEIVDRLGKIQEYSNI